MCNESFCQCLTRATPSLPNERRYRVSSLSVVVVVKVVCLVFPFSLFLLIRIFIFARFYFLTAVLFLI